MRFFLTVLAILFGTLLDAAEPQANVGSDAGVYHELTCPSVDATRMVRMTRVAAVYRGAVPAADCHAGQRMRYLGVTDPGGAPAIAPDAAKIVHVNGYVRDGKFVSGYDRTTGRRASP
jgi:hypothetical protein